MAHLASILSLGVAAVAAWNLLVPPGAIERPASSGPQVRLAGPAADATQPRPLTATTDVDRSHKSDRLVLSGRVDQPRPVVAKIEIGTGQAVVFRDRTGAVLFGSDPGAQLTTIAKNAALPEITLPGAVRIAPANVPSIKVEMPTHDAKPMPVDGEPLRAPPKRPVGCDPAFSPITAPQLGHITGRCITRLDIGVQLASTE